MNILVAFNDGYVMPTKVMLKSLILNEPEEITIFVLYVELKAQSIESIKSLADNKRVFIKFIQIDGKMLDGAPIGSHFSKEAYIRLYAHSFLDESIDRILWLDGDMIINGTLSYFYNLEFDGKVFIAEKDSKFGDDAEKKMSLGMPLDDIYINSGVLLINLAAARRVISESKIKQYIEEHKECIKFVDQDVFNGLLYSYFKVVDTNHLYNFFSRDITAKNKDNIYKKAHVIHYGGMYKPWNRGYMFYGFRIWWKYAFLADDSYRKRYNEILLSCIYGKIKHKIAQIIKR